MTVVVSVAEQPRTRDVDRETERCNPRRLGVGYACWLEEPLGTFDTNTDRDDCQNESARKPREVTDLPGSKGEAPVMGMATGE